MPKFLYNAIDNEGKKLSGVIEEPDRHAAAKSLSLSGYLVMDINEAPSGAAGRRKVSVEALINFTRKLRTMLNAGVPILTAVTLLWEQTEEKDLQIIVSEIGGQLGRGDSFSKSLRAYPEVFSDLYVHLVEVGEKGGMFADALDKAIEDMTRQRDIRKKVEAAIRYPLIVLGAALLVTAAMFIFVIPVFKNVFLKINVELPLITQVLITISDGLLRTWWLFLIGGVAGFFAFKGYVATAQGRYALDRFKLQVPVIGPLVASFVLSRFIHTFAVLFGAGLPIAETFEGAKNSCGNEYVKEKIAGVMEMVKQGKSISAALREAETFPPFVCQMVAIGEQSGALGDMLKVIGDSVDEDIDFKVAQSTELLGPISIAVVGVLVALILFAIYAPITSLWSGLGSR